MVISENKTLNKKKTLIFIFIHKISPKNMQDFHFFLQEKNFAIKRITQKNKKKHFTSIFANANFILESQQNIRGQQLQEMLPILHQNSQINGIFFNNQIFNLERANRFEEKSLFSLWKTINKLRF